MISLVEIPKKWNLSVYRSVADVFDGVAKGPKGKKALVCTAALLMYLRADKEEQRSSSLTPTKYCC